MKPTTMIVDDPLLPRPPVVKLAGAQRSRLRLMYEATVEGLKLPEGTRWWPALAPLKRKRGATGESEFSGVLKEVVRLRAMTEQERSVELLFLAAQIGADA